MLWLFIFGAATFITAIRYQTSIGWIQGFAMFRYVILYFWMTQTNALKKNWVYIMKFVTGINFGVCLLQALVPNIYKIFSFLYKHNGSSAYIVLESMWEGNYNRLFGTFSTPAVTSYLFLITTICFFIQYFYVNNTKENLIYLILSVSGGLGTATKAYNMGIIMILLATVCLWIIFKLYHKIKNGKNLRFWKKKYRYTIPIICLGVILFATIFEVQGVRVTKYLKNINVIQALQTRYMIGVEGDDGEDKHIAATTEEMTAALEGKETIIGFGATKPKGEKVQDGEWPMLFHDTGYLGLFLVFLLVGGLWIKNLIRMQIENLLYLLVIIALGLAIKSLLSLLGILLLSYITVNDNEINEKRFIIEDKNV